MEVFINYCQKMWKSKLNNAIIVYLLFNKRTKEVVLHLIFEFQTGFSMQASSPSDTKLILPHVNIVFNWAFISEQVLIKFPRISYKCDINVTLVCLSFFADNCHR